VLIGRANMDEFAMGSSTESSHYGNTKNPWDTSRVPGGSSGGSAAAVAAGYAPAALGSDTGGSVRQPAALCGVVGLKPTYGRVSRYGLMALASSLDQIGPITRTVEDAAILMRAIEGKDAKDSTSVEAESYIPEIDQPNVKGLRIGIPKEYFLEGMNGDVKDAVMEAVSKLEAAGAIVKPISLPNAEYALATYYLVMPAEASSNLARYDGIRYGYSASADSLKETYERSRGEGFGAEAQRRIILGTYVLSKGYYDAYYRKALKARELIRRDFEAAFKDVDVIATPTSPTTAWKLGEKFNDPLTMYLSDIYTISANLAGIPALSMPCGFSDGLPIGLQLMGRPFDEATLYRTGIAYQSLTDWHTRTP
jgi:aspartyl-tRNA(Asn)/glutamyl-tRNA(Gln) amidotransferase subunit A